MDLGKLGNVSDAQYASVVACGSRLAAQGATSLLRLVEHHVNLCDRVKQLRAFVLEEGRIHHPGVLFLSKPAGLQHIESAVEGGHARSEGTRATADALVLWLLWVVRKVAQEGAQRLQACHQAFRVSVQVPAPQGHERRHHLVALEPLPLLRTPGDTAPRAALLRPLHRGRRRRGGLPGPGLGLQALRRAAPGIPPLGLKALSLEALLLLALRFTALCLETLSLEALRLAALRLAALRLAALRLHARGLLLLPARGLSAGGLPALGLPALGIQPLGLLALDLPALGLPALGLPLLGLQPPATISLCRLFSHHTLARSHRRGNAPDPPDGASPGGPG
mmetsp:Transcript_15898/g.50886  ORF Transcript_15898/g.50886 Transcript_15898/m.50886 type:complete len:336 (-) Transcript_15898:1226-2233(-)